MTDVAVLILHPEPDGRAGELERWVGAARAAIAERHRAGFLAAGASDVTITGGPPDDLPFAARLRAFVAERRPGGVVVLGSGAIPLATAADRRELVEAAASGAPVALANNRYSADVIAVSQASRLDVLPDLTTDNALPRWLSEIAGYRVDDLRRRWRLGLDVDGPLDVVLMAGRVPAPAPPAGVVDRVVGRLRLVRSVAQDPAAELVVAGRTSATTLAWLERHTAVRTRALVEERGFRTGVAGQRPPRSILGAALDRSGPGGLGTILGELGDAAVVDTRVLLAHRAGRDEAGWPSSADRFGSDLLLHERIADGWLRELTASAADARIPIVLGGHTLVGPGLRLALGRTASWT